MKEISFLSLNLARLPNIDAASLFKSTATISIPFISYLGEIANLILTDLIPKSDDFVEQANRNTKNELTDPMSDIRKENKLILAEIKRTVVFMKKSRDLQKKTAATDFDFFMLKYWYVSENVIVTQLELTNEILTKYKTSTKAKSDAVLIGVDLFMTEFEESTKALHTIYYSRNEIIGTRKATGTDLRPGASECYSQYCAAIEQQMNFKPSDQLLVLFKSMDELRKKMHGLTGKSKGKPDEPTEPTPPTEPTDE